MACGLGMLLTVAIYESTILYSRRFWTSFCHIGGGDLTGFRLLVVLWWVGFLIQHYKYTNIVLLILQRINNL